MIDLGIMILIIIAFAMEKITAGDAVIALLIFYTIVRADRRDLYR